MAPTTESQQFLNNDDLQQILSDALASFSPLAALVGAESARSLSQHVTNMKQTFVASIAPIGALGMMASLVKGANLQGLKDMLGEGDSDIYDSCRDLGCDALRGVTPRMALRGGLTSRKKEFNAGVAACGIIRGSFSLSSSVPTLETVTAVLENIASGTVSGRISWTAKDQEDQQRLSAVVQNLLRHSWRSGQESQWDVGMFDSFKDSPALQGGQGMIEVHWPAPGSMTFETNARVIYLYGTAVVLSTLTLAFVSTFLLRWQSVVGISLLVGGQMMLIIGHMGAQWFLKNQREIKHVDLPRNQFSDTWMMVDNVWFTSRLARRKVTHPTLHSNLIRLGQHYAMKGEYIPTWQALIALFFIGVGFVTFYIGARSSHAYTILIYLVIFLAVNMTKGSVIAKANKTYLTNLNNPGYRDVVNRPKASRQPLLRRFRLWWPRKWCLASAAAPTDLDESEVETKVLERQPTQLTLQESLAVTRSQRQAREASIRSLADSVTPFDPLPLPAGPASTSPLLVHEDGGTSSVYTFHSVPTHPEDTLAYSTLALNTSLPSSRPSSSRTLPLPFISTLPPMAVEYRLYTKFALRDPAAMGMFYYSSPRTWSMAAHAIYEACERTISWHPFTYREPFLYLPFDYVESIENPNPKTVSSILLVAIDETRHEDLFWNTGAEFLSILTDSFLDSTHLCSESDIGASGATGLQLFVYFVARLIVMGHLAPPPTANSPTGATEPVGPTSLSLPGLSSLMRSIDLIRIKYPVDDSEWSLHGLRQSASSAVNELLMPMP